MKIFNNCVRNMKQRVKIASLLLALFCVTLAQGQGAVTRRIHVDASASCGFTCDGSAGSPFASILSALRSISADDNRVELLVSPGRYNGSGNTGLTINYAQNVFIRSTSGAQSTIIDCAGNAARAFYVLKTTFSLQGFTIQNCNHKANGGAIFIVDSPVRLDAVHFINNTALNGGAVYAVTLPPTLPSSLTLTSSSFKLNKALNKGGAFYVSRIQMTASNSVIKCNYASNLLQSSGNDFYCESNSAAVFDLSSDVQGMGVSCPISGCSITYQNLTDSGMVSQQLCGAASACRPLSDQPNDSAPDVPDFMGLCGNGKCDQQFESCLSCSQDCPTCSFTGVKLEAFKCLPQDVRNATKRSDCFVKATSQPVPLIEKFLPTVPRPVMGLISGYFRVAETDRYSFKLLAQNLGAKLRVNSRTLIDAFFPQPNIDSVASLYLSKDFIHTIEVEFYSTRDFNNSLQVLFKLSNSTVFSTFDKVFYSLNDCGDGILDPKENESSQPFFCPTDVNKCQTYSCGNQQAITPTCGNGVCDEEFKEDCFIDCFSQFTKLCPQLQEPAGQQTSGIPLANDTLGLLLKNQYYYRLPGVESLMNGFDILNGEESTLPIFYFGFCDKKIVKTVQDSWRGFVYTVPAEIFAQPYPQCSFSMDSQRYASSSKMAENKAKKTAVSASASGGGGYGGVTASGGAAFSKEKSVQEARELESSMEGSLLVTEVQCLSSKAQMVDYTFHPVFLSDLALVDNVTSMLPLLYKYGTHFYDYVSFGGKLTQVRVVSKSYDSSKSSRDVSKSSQRSFSSSVSSPACSVSTTYTRTNEVHTTAEEQQEFEDNSISSKIITYGGAPGSFGPQDEDSSDAPTNFGQWAESVDLLPVPVDYQLRRISSVLPSSWKTRSGNSIADLWQQAETVYYRENRIIPDDVAPSQFKAYLKFDRFRARDIATFLDLIFFDFSTNQSSSAIFNLTAWNSQGVQLLDASLNSNSAGFQSVSNTISFSFDAPSTLANQATHVAVGFKFYRIRPDGTIDFTASVPPTVLQHVILHDVEAGEQSYFSANNTKAVQLSAPFNATVARPKKFKHNSIFLQYSVTNLNVFPPISPFGTMEPYSAEITFVGTKNKHTVWQPLMQLPSDPDYSNLPSYYWPDSSRSKIVFEIYENIPPYQVLGDLQAIQIRIGGLRNSVWQSTPDHITSFYARYQIGDYIGGYYMPRLSEYQDPEKNHPNPKYSIGDIWASMTRCLDLDEQNVCRSGDAQGVSKVYVSNEYQVVQLLTDQRTTWLMSELEP